LLPRQLAGFEQRLAKVTKRRKRGKFITISEKTVRGVFRFDKTERAAARDKDLHKQENKQRAFASVRVLSNRKKKR